MKLFVNTEVDRNEGKDDFFVAGVYSDKAKAQKAMAASIRLLKDSDPEGEPFQIELTEEGLMVRSCKGHEYVYNIVERTLDEEM